VFIVCNGLSPFFSRTGIMLFEANIFNFISFYLTSFEAPCSYTISAFICACNSVRSLVFLLCLSLSPSLIACWCLTLSAWSCLTSCTSCYLSLSCSLMVLSSAVPLTAPYSRSLATLCLC